MSRRAVSRSIAQSVHQLEARRLLAAFSGDLDTTYNTPTGYLEDPVGMFATSVVVQHGLTPAQDKILIAGLTGGFNPVLTRYNLDGTLDTSFGSSGTYVASVIASTNVRITIDSQDRIVVGGDLIDNSDDVFALRLDADGGTDFSFNGGMVASVSRAGSQWFGGIATDANDNVYIAGGGDEVFIQGLDSFGVVASFGTAGHVAPAVGTSGDMFKSIVIQPDGKMVLGGTSNFFAAIVRLNSDGSLDDGGIDDITPLDSFGTGGVTEFTAEVSPSVFVGGEIGTVRLVGGDIVGGGVLAYPDHQTIAAFRTDGDGVADNGFGDGGAENIDGVAEIGIGSGPFEDVFGSSMNIDSSNRVVVVGSHIDPGDSSLSIAVARFNSDGSADLTFGVGGSDGENGLVVTSVDRDQFRDVRGHTRRRQDRRRRLRSGRHVDAAILGPERSRRRTGR